MFKTHMPASFQIRVVPLRSSSSVLSIIFASSRFAASLHGGTFSREFVLKFEKCAALAMNSISSCSSTCIGDEALKSEEVSRSLSDSRVMNNYKVVCVCE
uniref:Uncharacterized protein n=1 Tax=Physcomitrium patens TaxID=3218 RepID=A0A2K1JQ93_PHYPA|nr:hypothetical protein PHYPA_016091 [Physcomitrium patens]